MNPAGFNDHATQFLFNYLTNKSSDFVSEEKQSAL